MYLFNRPFKEVVRRDHGRAAARVLIVLVVFLLSGVKKYSGYIAAEGDFGCGVPQCPFVRPKTGMGGRGHSRGETRCQSGPNMRVFSLTCGYLAWGACVNAAGCQIGRDQIVALARFGYVPEGQVCPLFSIWPRVRCLVIEIRQIWGWASESAPSLVLLQA